MASREHRIGRRQFLGRSVGTTVGFGCFTTHEMKSVAVPPRFTSNELIIEVQGDVR